MNKERTMKTAFSIGTIVLAASPLLAGDIHGKVDCKGLLCTDAVVYVAAIPGKTFPAPQASVKMDQKNMKFEPHVLPVLVGTTVDFLNSDSVTHNVFTPDACAGKFNLGTWPKGQSKPHVFAKECPTTILCMIHPEMEAFVVAVPTPYFAVPAADGSYKLVDVPDGSVTVKIWHPKLKPTEKVVAVHGPTEANFELAK